MSTQGMEALEVAQQVRLAAAAVIAEVSCETLSISDALNDERAACLRIGRLLCAQRSWGPKKSTALLAGLGISPTRRVRDLTERQRSAFSETTADMPDWKAKPVDLALRGHIEFMVTDATAMAEGLRAVLIALQQGVEPNVIWAPQYRLAIMVEGGT